MIDQKLAIITIHDVNPSHSEKILKTSDKLDKLKIKYNLSIVPYYSKRYDLKDHIGFCDKISSLLESGNVELTLHGLYHQVDGKLDDFDKESKEDEKKEIQQGLDILSATGKLPRNFNVYPTSMAFRPSMYRRIKRIQFRYLRVNDKS